MFVKNLWNSFFGVQVEDETDEVIEITLETKDSVTGATRIWEPKPPMPKFATSVRKTNGAYPIDHTNHPFADQEKDMQSRLERDKLRKTLGQSVMQFAINEGRINNKHLIKSKNFNS